MLETLDEVPWSGLSHAYGSASDVPDQIRMLLSDDPSQVRGVLFTFTCNIFHQGTRYPATVAAVPFFLEMLPHVPVETQVGILDLLTHIATGYPEQPLTRDEIWQMARPVESSEEERQEFDPIFRDCYGQVAAGLWDYLTLLESAPATAIAASRLLAFFPLHAFVAGGPLLAIARNDRKDPLLRASCLLALGYLQGADVVSQASLYCDSLLAQYVRREGKTPVVVAAAAYCLFAIADASVSIDCEQAERVADHALRQGIEMPTADYYESREVPEEIESSQDYYEAFLEPRASFPWNIEAELRRVRKSRSLEPSEVGGNPEELAHQQFEQTLADFQSATGSERAVTLALSLLLETFGEWNGYTISEYPRRIFPTQKWTEGQRRILNEIAQCDLVWPAIAHSLHGYLHLDFDPTRQELIDALAGKAPPGAEDDFAEFEIDLSDEGVLAATQRLYESFAIKRRDLSAELKRYEPYRPHSAAGLPFLLERLVHGESLDERRSAAWAIGRLKEYGAAAGPALLRQIEQDPENEYAGSALTDLPRSDEFLEDVVDLMERKPAQFSTLLRIAGDRIPIDRLRRWLNLAPALRGHALWRLSQIAFDEVCDELLPMLDSDDETVRQAEQCLSLPTAIPWYVANLEELPRERRMQLANGFVHSWAGDFGVHRELIYSAIQATDDPELAVRLLQIVHRFRSFTSLDLDRCRELSDKFDTAEWKLEIIGLLNRFTAVVTQAEVEETLRPLLFHESEYVRAAAIDAMPGEIEGTKWRNAMLSDSSPLVRCTMVWKLAEQGDADGEIRRQWLPEEASDRVAVDLVWSLAAAGQLPASPKLGRPGEMPLSESLLAALS